MKTRTSLTGLFASLGAASLVALSAPAQTSAPATTPTTPTAGESAPVRLPYGVEDVLKLSRAQVNEDVTLNYIHNTGTIYNLAPKDIVYLRNEGVSDRVINAMQDQRKNVPAEATAQTAPPAATAAAPAPVYSDASAAAPVQAAVQYAPTYVQPAPVYVQPEPTYAAASTLYVIPYPYAGCRYTPCTPFYGRFYPYCGSSFVYSFGYGNRGRCGGYYGGHYGGHYGYRGHR